MTAIPSQPTYRGRFAPSPSGPLHFGSLVAAVGSYLQAKHAHGQWLVRIEDIDPPRAVAGAAELILQTLESHGFEWDEAVLYQSTRSAAYEHALRHLYEQQRCYPCSCTRSELQALAGEQPTGDELYYPGLCRNGPLRTQDVYAWRFRVPSEPIGFDDRLQGSHSVHLQPTIGDFVVKRRDGWFAYQLAVVVDDAAQGITEVVRGADLLFNTPRQIALQDALGLPTPAYVHLPLATDAAGHKLAKSNAAPALNDGDAVRTLWQALHFLQQRPPVELQTAALATLWSWAIEHWRLAPLAGLRAVAAGDCPTA